MRGARMVFVTGNEHKRREVREILGVELEAADLDVPEVQGIDPGEVAAAKALAAREALGSPEAYVLAEDRSEEHTSELQSRQYLVCRLLLEKKKKKEKWNSIMY